MSDAVEHQGSISELEAKPPASNPGSDDPTGGIAPGNGGRSSAAHVGSPLSVDATDAPNSANQTITTQVSELVSSIATRLGFGGASSEQNEGSEPHPTENDKTISQTAQDYAAAGGAAVTATAASAAAFVTSQGKQTGPTTSSDGSPRSRNNGNINSSQSASDSSSTTQASDVTDSTAESVKPSTTQTTTDPSSTSKMSDTTAKPSTDDSVPNREVAAEAAEKGQGKSLEPSGDPPASQKEGGTSSKGGARMENPDAIPTAGGERLGSKHMGESEVVPELPPVRDEEGAGVASADGQPTKQVESNTAKNTGAATDGPGSDSSAAVSSEDKPGVLGKVKGALRIN